MQDLRQIYSLPNTSSEGATDFIIMNASDKLGYAFAEETARMYTVLFFTDGSGKITFGVNTSTFTSPSVFFLAAHQPFRILPNTELKGTIIRFATDFFCIDQHHSEVGCQGLLFNNVYDVPSITPTLQIENELNALIVKMEQEFVQQELPDRELLSTYLKVFLKLAVREKRNLLKDNTSVPTADRPVLLQLRQLIEEHFRTIKSPSAYAELLHITPKALGKIVKEHFGRTLTEMIQERVVFEAKKELFTTHKTIKEISASLGYDDQYYFSRMFKNFTSVSPEKYRQTIHF